MAGKWWLRLRARVLPCHRIDMAAAMDAVGGNHHTVLISWRMELNGQKPSSCWFMMDAGTLAVGSVALDASGGCMSFTWSHLSQPAHVQQQHDQLQRLQPVAAFSLACSGLGLVTRVWDCCIEHDMREGTTCTHLVVIIAIWNELQLGHHDAVERPHIYSLRGSSTAGCHLASKLGYVWMGGGFALVSLDFAMIALSTASDQLAQLAACVRSGGWLYRHSRARGYTV
jgi:hypothetical protein